MPEYPGHTEQNNPALKGYKNGLPDFENITEAHCYYGLGQRLMEFESAFDDEPPKIDFIANHPFIFFLRDLQTGLLLFQGRLSDPTD